MSTARARRLPSLPRPSLLPMFTSWLVKIHRSTHTTSLVYTTTHAHTTNNNNSTGTGDGALHPTWEALGGRERTWAWGNIGEALAVSHDGAKGGRHFPFSPPPPESRRQHVDIRWHRGWRAHEALLPAMALSL
eukprot:scaffold10803_cov36-Tisochrysis_lutea.AAC.1